MIIPRENRSISVHAARTRLEVAGIERRLSGWRADSAMGTGECASEQC